MITLSLPTVILAAIGILQVGVVLGMWFKTAFAGGCDIDVQTVKRYPHKPVTIDEVLKEIDE